MVIDDQGKTLWSLSVRRKRIDGLLNVTKKVVTYWWAYETFVNPNRKYVTQKRITTSVF